MLVRDNTLDGIAVSLIHSINSKPKLQTHNGISDNTHSYAILAFGGP